MYGGGQGQRDRDDEDRKVYWGHKGHGRGHRGYRSGVDGDNNEGQTGDRDHDKGHRSHRGHRSAVDGDNTEGHTQNRNHDRGYRGHQRSGEGHRQYRGHGWGERDDDKGDNHRRGRHGRHDGGARRGHDEGGWGRRGSDEGGGSRRGQDEGAGNRPPPGLKGREIGMWYASRSKKKTERMDKDNRSVVKLDEGQEANIKALLQNIKSSREAPTQPATSGANLIHSVKEEVMDTFPDTPSVSSTMNAASSLSETLDTDTGADTDDIDVPAVTELMELDDENMFTKDEDKVVHWQVEASMEADCDLDQELLAEYRDKQKYHKGYQRMMEGRTKLPSYDQRQEILDQIRANQVVVLSGETGCGKTTQVPQFILDDFIEQGKGSQCRIICTQPRRISAISVAERVAAERSESCGEQSVGYIIRLENKLPRTRGSILYCTTGILLKMLESDPLLQQTTHIILDEIHERDLLSDFLIIILKEILPRRPDLKLVLMSATLNAEAFSKYYDNAAMINIPGFTYPVQDHLLEDVIQLLNYNPPATRQNRRKKLKPIEIEESEHREVWLRNMDKKYSRSTKAALQQMDMTKIDLDLIKQLIDHIVTTKKEGAILVFVPGWSEINNLNKLLTADRIYNSSQFKIIPLHSMLPTVNQREVFDKPRPGVRKIVIATNIAETSITINDVVYVIDGGRIKMKDFTPENSLMSLDSQMVSRANARQRRGRAGRVQPGECFHLYTGLQESLMLDYLPPEILRTRLEELCLNIKLLKLGDIVTFVGKAMQQPSKASLQSAIVNLKDLNALDQDENLLPLGKHLARMPLDIHTGKMILFGAMFGCLDPILTIAASLNFKDPFFTPMGKEKESDLARLRLAYGCGSDHILLVNAYKEWERAMSRGQGGTFCWKNFLSESTLRMLKKMREQLYTVLQDMGFVDKGRDNLANKNSDNEALVKAIVCAGLYPNIAKIKRIPNKPHMNMKFHTKKDGACELHPKSVSRVVKDPGTQWITYHEKMKLTSVFVFDCSFVTPYSLLFFGGQIEQLKEDGVSTVAVDDWIRFKASKKTVDLVKELRAELDAILDQKISRSHDTIWGQGTKEAAFIQAIIDLITTEDTS